MARPPAKGLVAREKQVVAAAVDLAEKQIREGTASPSVLVHYLKLGTSSYNLELEKLRHENELLEAKRDNLRSMARMEELYEEAIAAYREYAGADE